MTAYKREGIPTLKGGHSQRLATSSKRKADMAAFDEALPALSSTQGIHAPGRRDIALCPLCRAQYRLCLVSSST